MTAVRIFSVQFSAVGQKQTTLLHITPFCLKVSRFFLFYSKEKRAIKMFDV